MKDFNGLTWVAGKATPDKVYITRVFNYGTWEEWQEMKKNLTPDQILTTLKAPLRGQWTRRAKAFAETVYGIQMSNDSLISYDA